MKFCGGAHVDAEATATAMAGRAYAPAPTIRFVVAVAAIAEPLATTAKPIWPAIAWSRGENAPQGAIGQVSVRANTGLSVRGAATGCKLSEMPAQQKLKASGSQDQANAS
jgi:hypothetical protein